MAFCHVKSLTTEARGQCDAWRRGGHLQSQSEIKRSNIYCWELVWWLRLLRGWVQVKAMIIVFKDTFIWKIDATQSFFFFICVSFFFRINLSLITIKSRDVQGWWSNLVVASTATWKFVATQSSNSHSPLYQDFENWFSRPADRQAFFSLKLVQHFFFSLFLPFRFCFGLILWHINRCRLFNAKSIFIQINSTISNKSV